MATSTDSKRSDRFRSAAQAERAERTAQVAGIADALRQAAALGPQVSALQQGLLTGIVQSQQREARRLAARHGKNDPRIAGAEMRAAAFGTLAAEHGARTEVARRFARTFVQDALFHGYVTDADGAPAANHTVRLHVEGAAERALQRKAVAKTGVDGYFRMDLRALREPKDAAPHQATVWIERLLQAMPDAAKADDDAAAAAGDRAQGAEAPKTAVEVLDVSGNVAFVDPAPPQFIGGVSEFRYYVLALSIVDQRKAPTRKRR